MDADCKQMSTNGGVILMMEKCSVSALDFHGSVAGILSSVYSGQPEQALPAGSVPKASVAADAQPVSMRSLFLLWANPRVPGGDHCLMAVQSPVRWRKITLFHYRSAWLKSK